MRRRHGRVGQGFNEAAIVRSRKSVVGIGRGLTPFGFNEAAIVRSRKYDGTRVIESD